MKNLGQMMKQIQGMQSQMADMQASLERLEMSGQSGGGMVSVTLNGKGEMRGVKIDPKLLDPAEVERKIGELKVIEGWLQMTLSMMQMSIKTMELQKASLEAMRAPQQQAEAKPTPKRSKS